MANKYKVEITEITDGDTVKGHLYAEELGIIKPDQKFRFSIVNCPEKEKEGYYEAKEFTANICEGKTLEITLHGGAKAEGAGGFGRWLATFFYEEDGVTKSLSEELLRLGLAVPYKKK